MTWAELTHPDDLDADIRQFDKVLADTINGYEMEKRFISKDGAVVFTKLVVRCVRKEGGEVDYVVAMVEDITGQKQAEREIRTYQEQLRLVASELSLTEERERRRLGTELHDNVGQVLALGRVAALVVQYSLQPRKYLDHR